jgi:phage gp36-like protein
MAAYTNAAGIYGLIGEDLVTDLLDLDEDDGDDSAVLTARITDAGAIVDAYLAKRYTVPFAAITDTPDTPDVVQLIAKKLVASELLKPRRELNAQREMYWKEAIDMLKAISSGALDVPGASELDADEAGIGFAFDDVEPVFAGHDDDLDDRMTGF